MFSNLTDFGFRRTKIQAFGFYITYLIVIMAIGAVIGIVTEVGVDQDTASFGNGMRLGAFFAIAASIVLSFMVLKAKKLTGNFSLSLLAISSGILALIGGGLLGLIIPTVFTTKAKKGTRG
jgi:hypothetical protein